MFKLIKIFVLALLLPVSANTESFFPTDDPEQGKRISKLVMQWGEIIHSTNMTFLGKDLIGGAVFHVRIKKPNRMELLGVPEGIYVCFAGLDVTATQLSEIEEDQTFISCEKL